MCGVSRIERLSESGRPWLRIILDIDIECFTERQCDPYFVVDMLLDRLNDLERAVKQQKTNEQSKQRLDYTGGNYDPCSDKTDDVSFDNDDEDDDNE